MQEVGIFAFMLVSLGLLGLLMRRNLVVMMLCSQLIFWGILLALSVFSQDANWLLLVFLVLLVLFAILQLLVCAACVFVYRHRATLNLDELRALRG